MKYRKNKHTCKRCGKCCTVTSFSFEDYNRWIQENRKDILKYTRQDSNRFHDQNDKPITKRCPFLKILEDGTYQCQIHGTKPTLCKVFPDWNFCYNQKQQKSETKNCNNC